MCRLVSARTGSRSHDSCRCQCLFWRATQRAAIDSSGGATGLRDLAALESAIAQPRATFDGIDLHANVTGKAAALAYSPALNHPFVDGNKRVAHAAMEVFLILNGLDLHADVDEQEAVFLELAAGRSSRRALEVWLERHTAPSID